jgi:hypothetical protein
MSGLFQIVTNSGTWSLASIQSSYPPTVTPTFDFISLRGTNA